MLFFYKDYMGDKVICITDKFEKKYVKGGKYVSK